MDTLWQRAIPSVNFDKSAGDSQGGTAAGAAAPAASDVSSSGGTAAGNASSAAAPVAGEAPGTAAPASPGYSTVALPKDADVEVARVVDLRLANFMKKVDIPLERKDELHSAAKLNVLINHDVKHCMSEDGLENVSVKLDAIKAQALQLWQATKTGVKDRGLPQVSSSPPSSPYFVFTPPGQIPC